jgi:hypothetical protein
MKRNSIRTTIDIPEPLYRKLKIEAAEQGRSVRELVLAGVHNALSRKPSRRRNRVKFPLIVSKGPKVDVTSERIFEHIEFP